ncbi:hypothetical protein [Marinoscillum furvescens]|uniref:Uncharacterized protein n=1 Tax=Marinoscillum furvescens DSM 4134 TaxID=1122208 RepID=A0A3D9L266_MARFU|nr:hypothetical protein [Marinoscillum furvescens]RED98841.1 hypothetical protein C7460_10933 [Marinoscillum furvescens DSM 4134]
MKKLLICGLVLIGLGCAENEQSVRALDAYFKLDSLLDAEVAYLTSKQAKLNKQVIMDGQEESQRFRPDSSQWSDEFVIIRDFSLNKPHYVGAYKKTERNGNTLLELNESIDAPVKSFELMYENGSLQQIQATYFEDKTIYQHKRDLTLTFEDNRLKAYTIKGFQKMVLKDTITYSISGKVSINE